MTAKRSIIIIPTQNVGRLKPSIDPVIMLLEAQDSGLSPAQTPNGIPNIIAIINETTASSIVAGIRSNISSKAGSLKTNDSPRFPLRAFEMKIPYWTKNGLSSPIDLIISSRSSWSASSLTKISTGSPIRNTPEKTMKDIITTTTPDCSRRLIMKTDIFPL